MVLLLALKMLVPGKPSADRLTKSAHSRPRKKIGFLDKHKDYVVLAKSYRKKEEILQKLREKAAIRNPDEFYFKIIRTKTVDGVHRPESEANKYNQEELMLMKTQDIGYVLQKAQSERKKTEKLTATLHSVDNQPSNPHVYFAEDRQVAKEIELHYPRSEFSPASNDIPADIKSLLDCK
ncbi:hypothetical protein L6164_034294 [Bauhinia variegata]|uniref:Uncharacterized protein n=1 Tax=Bauhinia variegata TaxID=167791 RepID=A0ACB9KU94_BAUVA|nr:hypothetical protein L6164_034294 [Bauhinia variegata]